jgi:hypothetical protein
MKTSEFLLDGRRGGRIREATDNLPAMDPIPELVDGPLAPEFCLHKPLTLEGRTVLVRQRQGC